MSRVEELLAALTGAPQPDERLAAAIATVRREAFAAIVAGRAASLPDVARRHGLDEETLGEAVAWLEERGAAERDADGLIVSAHGVTHHETPHMIEIDGRWVHTWCAFDAVGIPVAVGLEARVRTSCPSCGAALDLRVRDGRVVDAARGDPVVWFPTANCSHVLTDFCASANLFCDRSHLAAWREASSEPAGVDLSMREVEDLARLIWEDVTATLA